jgi:hypothetical protein
LIAIPTARRALLIIAAICATASTSLADTTEPMGAVRQYIDVEGLAATCAVPASILDGMAPHVWQGPTACKDWYRDVLTTGEREGATGYFVTLEEPRHVDVSGDRGYVVVPAIMTFKVHGKQVTQSGSTFTVALQKLPAGSRITAWAWAKGAQIVADA